MFGPKRMLFPLNSYVRKVSGKNKRISAWQEMAAGDAVRSHANHTADLRRESQQGVARVNSLADELDCTEHS